MKKIMFLIMMFGLVMIFSQTTSAQTFNLTVGSGFGTPAAGQKMIDDIHARRNDEPAAPAGTKYYALKFIENGKPLVVALGQIPEEAQRQWKPGMKGERTISKVDSPIAIRAYDTLKLSILGGGQFQIEVVRSNKSVGTMKLYTN